jgi:hypothetical protein
MGRQRRGRHDAAEEPGSGSGPVAGTYVIDTGTAELVPDGSNPSGWLLKLNGVQSSHLDLADPLRLDFEYMRWIMALVESHWPPTADATGRLRALHLGGAACSMARYLVAAYPNSRNVVVEIDGTLAGYVRDWFDLPRAPLLKIRVGEAREVTESLPDASRDLVIRDVFAGPLTPRPLTTVEFTRHARRVLAPGGIYVLNCGDGPSLVQARREAATVAEVFPHTVLMADPPMLKGRRYGNVIVAGSDVPLGTDPGLPRVLLGGAMPAQLWDDGQVRRFSASSLPLHDPDPETAPDPTP